MTLLNFKLAIRDESPRRREDTVKEKMFLESYSWLVECALNITHGQRERAEDLVHDVFVCFLDKDADIASICNVRGYLNGMLRNLHLLQLRRATRHPVQSLTLIDHDSALVGLRTWNSVEQLQSADLLFRACDFACYRKEIAVTSSVLILRFFHGFYPGEICALLKAGRKAVDKWILRGRNEIKQYLASPYPLPDSGRAEYGKSIPESASAFLRHLREHIFDSCTSSCSVLTKNADELGARELAHLVSCRTCLCRRSRDAGLTHVAERMADDISDRNDAGPQGRGSGEISLLRGRRKPTKRAILRDVCARRRELFEHRPKEISLVSDGVPRATLVVNAATNTLNVSLDSKEVPNSVAVLSEQEFNLLLLDHDDLTCGERRVHRSALSDNRSLEVTVTPETIGPSIQIVYLDPFFAVETDSADEDEPRSINAKHSIIESPFRFKGSVADFRPERGTTLFDRLRNWIPAMNPLLTSAIVFGATAAMCFVLWLRSTPSPSVGEILDHAEETDRAAGKATRPGVIYEKVAIRTRHRTLERAIYRDAQGIRHPRRQPLSPEDEQLKDKLASAGVSWDAPLSALDFAEWRHRSRPTRDTVKRSGQHLLTLTTRPLADNTVLKETLTVRDTDFQGVDRTVELRDSGTVEIAQLNYDVLPWGAVNQDWFESLPSGAATDAPGGLSGLSIHSSRLPSKLELETELAVRYALHGLGADLGEPIEIHSGGPTAELISVVGVVSSAQRKQELFAFLKRIPGVAARLRTEEEAAPRKLPTRVMRAEPLIVTAHSPIEAELLNYFGDPLAVESFSKRAIALTRDLTAHAWALRHLSERYGAPRVAGELALSPASLQLLETMRRDHCWAMSDATSELTASLRPVLSSIVKASPKATTRLSLFDGAQQVQRLTMELAFGSRSPNGDEMSDPAKAAQDLLDALQGLEITLEGRL